MRTAALLEWLSSRYAVDAVLFGEALPIAADVCAIPLPRHSRSPWARLARNLGRAWRDVAPLVDRFSGFDSHLAGFAPGRRWDLCVIEHFWCAPYADTLARRADKLVLDLHNVESAPHSGYAASTPWPMSALHRRFAASAGRLEREWLPRFDLVLTASEADRARIAPLSRASAVYPNTVRDRPVPTLPKRHQIVFAGNHEYQPNQDGTRWFARHVWPALSHQHPRLEWVLLGKNAHAIPASIRNLPNVRVTGEVEDTLPDLAQSLVMVVPLLSGSGTRLKILEAWMARLPVVSTTIGAEGLPTDSLILADSPLDFINAVNRLLGDGALREHLATSAAETFHQQFTWEAGWKVLDRLAI
jgi:glycosyltransferase involved in cell wall biosynthesis